MFEGQQQIHKERTKKQTQNMNYKTHHDNTTENQILYNNISYYAIIHDDIT